MPSALAVAPGHPAWLVLIGLIVAALAPAALADSPPGRLGTVVVLDRRTALAPGTTPRNAQWLGLFCEQDTCELRQTSVRIQRGSAKRVDGAREPAEFVRTAGAPVALLSGVPLKPGPVLMRFRDATYQDAFEPVRLGKPVGRWKHNARIAPMRLTRVLDLDDEVHRLILHAGSRHQVLMKAPNRGWYGDDLTFYVRWVGDLDGDGDLDFLVSTWFLDCRSEDLLFLSGMRKAGETVHLAAKRTIAEVACGC